MQAPSKEEDISKGATPSNVVHILRFVFTRLVTTSGIMSNAGENAALRGAAAAMVTAYVLRKAGQRLAVSAAWGGAVGAVLGTSMFMWDTYRCYQLISEQRDEDEPRCCICFVEPPTIECPGGGGSSTIMLHGFCTTCFNHYATTAFEQGGGGFEREQIQDGSVSRIGELACPLFVGGGCTCGAFSFLTLVQNFSEQVAQSWIAASNRVAVASAERERLLIEQNRRETEQQQTPVNVLVEAVNEALMLGGTVPCPNCTLRGEKDDGCMHITCRECGCRWCYCCGRERGTGLGQCSSCDRNSASIEYQPGWRNLNIGNESQGYGALHEFHRRRMAYFLCHIKTNTPVQLWNRMCNGHADLLENVPTPGRRIGWREIDRATQPPVFGLTQTSDLRWINDAEQVSAGMHDRLQRLPSQTCERNDSAPGELEMCQHPVNHDEDCRRRNVQQETREAARVPRRRLFRRLRR